MLQGLTTSLYDFSSLGGALIFGEGANKKEVYAKKIIPCLNAKVINHPADIKETFNS